MIRPAVLADLPALTALEQELFGADAWSEALIRQEIEGPGRRFVVADDLSGYAVTMTAGDIVDLHDASPYAPRRAARGLASRLLDELLVDTEDAVPHAARGACRQRRRPSGSTTRAQFSVIDVRPPLLPADGVDALVMARCPAAARGRRPRMTDEPLVLGIETSCDETGVGIVRGHTLLADAVASSVDEHARFGGVVPEVASRAHLEAMVPTIERACETAGHRAARRRRDRRDQRPGPRRRAARRRRRGQGAGASALGKPIYGVNHLAVARRRRPARARPAARAAAWRMLVSGGHSSLLRVADVTTGVEPLGATIDDAAGEAFDKVARLLGLPFPGGPHIDRAARERQPRRHRLPARPHRPAATSSGTASTSPSPGSRPPWRAGSRPAQRAGEPVPVADVAASLPGGGRATC